VDASERVRILCGKYFTINVGFEKMRATLQGITAAMQLYFTGESPCNTSKALKRIGVQVSHKTVFMWIDGLMTFHAGYMKEFYTHKLETRTEHIRHITVQGDHNNNKMERFNGEVRDREKVIRGLRKPDSPLLDGYQIYHNYIRPHEALDGETPADRSGIRILGENKWLIVVQNASWMIPYGGTLEQPLYPNSRTNISSGIGEHPSRVLRTKVG
jgi:hypothetical protein